MQVPSRLTNQMHTPSGPISAIALSGDYSEPIRDWQVIVVFLLVHNPGYLSTEW